MWYIIRPEKDFLMPATFTTFPLNNADSALLTLVDGRRLLFDFADVGKSPSSEVEFDLDDAIRSDLRAANRTALDVLCITHVDRDHCFGFADTFWLEHAAKFQSDDRIRIDELWVPAAAIIEEGLDEECAIHVQKEAQHRLLNGYGIKVFSTPKNLEKWLGRRGLSLSDRIDCFVKAGEIVAGYHMDDEGGAEFFAHCPLKWIQDSDGEVIRNEHSIVLQATIRVGSRDTRILLGSDIDSETISEIVRATRRHGNAERLEWDVLHLFHHCSYKALNKDDRGDDVGKTTPVDDVAWFIEQQGRDRSIIISPSKKIPSKGSKEDDAQPPHPEAAAYYRSIQRSREGQFLVTMDDPNKPLKITITAFGAQLALTTAALIGTGAASKPMRAG